MKASPIAIFAAHARITTLNLAIAGVLPNSEGSLFCVTAANVLRPIRGVQREGKVAAPGGDSYGTTLRCPA